LNVTYIVAQTPSTKNPATAPAGEPPAYLQFVPIILLVVIFYIFMFRSKNTEKQKREGMLKELKKGDEVQTIGGVFGRVMETRDDRVLVKVDESTNTKMWFTRSAIHRVVTDDAKTETK
jgi:preprotein translocase subunit YajC